MGIYRGVEPAIILRDPDLIKDVLIKDFPSFNANDLDISEKTDPLLANFAIAVTGDKWKRSRSMLTPLFTASKVMFIPGDDFGIWIMVNSNTTKLMIQSDEKHTLLLTSFAFVFILVLWRISRGRIITSVFRVFASHFQIKSIYSNMEFACNNLVDYLRKQPNGLDIETKSVKTLLTNSFKIYSASFVNDFVFSFALNSPRKTLSSVRSV